MRIEHVVVNASPLICLSKSGLSHLLPELFSEVAVPDKVYREVTRKTGIDLSTMKLTMVADIPLAQTVTSWDLGEGEGAVLSFALQNPDYWAVIDDREARRCAASLNCHLIGTVGVVILAKRRGVIKSVRDSLTKLQTSGLWLSDSFIVEVCRLENENN